MTPYFQFEKKFDFLFVYVMNTIIRSIIFCVCLPGIMENGVNCHGKVMEFDYQISVGTLCILRGAWCVSESIYDILMCSV